MRFHLPICLLAIAGAIAAAAVHAQAAPDAPAASPPWRSAFDGYQPFSDDKALPWRQANDTVQGVGGWRAYAREAARPASAAASAPPARAGDATGHGAHHKQ